MRGRQVHSSHRFDGLHYNCHGCSPARRGDVAIFTYPNDRTLYYVKRIVALPGDKVRITTQILDHDAKRVHYVQQMFHAEEGYLACVTENMVLHVSMETRRSAPFPADVQARIDEMAAAHKGLAIPPQVGHRIGIPRK